MCLVTTVQHISFKPAIPKDSDDSLPSRKNAGLRLSDFLANGRLLAVAILLTAYVGHQANESTNFASVNLTLFVKERPTNDNWWVVIYALVAYTMFGSRRWLIHRSIHHISKATSSAFKQVTSTQTLTNIRSTVSMKSIQLFGAVHDDEHCGKRTLTLSIEKPFVSESQVASMTIRDVSDVFRYIFQCDTVDFDHDVYVGKLREPALKAIETLGFALRSSRGERVMIRSCEKCSEFGSLDALAFIGACRIYAEWMTIRLVPDGYGRYAFGMGIAKRDMIGNISKAEKAVHAYLDQKVQEANGETVYSATIRDILEFEIASNLHPHKPKLGNNTAAQGILWLKRQLQYHVATFSNTLEIGLRFPDDKAASRAAYEETYGKYHGFFVKQIFQSTYDLAPPQSTILHHMNLPKFQNVQECDDATVAEDEDDDIVPAVPLPPPQHPVLDFIGNVFKDNIAKLGQCLGMEGHGHPSQNVLSPSRGSATILRASSPNLLIDPNGVDKDVSEFLYTIRPFLHGLDNLLEELRLNDPSRV
eukprot:scaffold3289_cov163-Amphora_coffeaeformis.AAC.6